MSSSPPPSVCNTVEDLTHAAHGDKRQPRRGALVAKAIQNNPSVSLPQVLADPSQIEAAYEILDDEREAVSEATILDLHRVKTAQRAASAGTVLVLHDTTSFRSGGGRPEIGVVDPGDSTECTIHTSLCVGIHGEPLGIARAHLGYPSGSTQGKHGRTESMHDPDSESWRWNEAVHEVDDQIRHEWDVGQFGQCPHIIHVMNREADCVVLLTDMLQRGFRATTPDSSKHAICR